MKVLFLDVDGVLNSAAWARFRGPGRPVEQMPRKEQELYYARRQLDPRAVARLNLIVEMTGCNVVLSSTWRSFGKNGLKRTDRMLRRRGFDHHLLDATPDTAQKVGAIFVGAERGAEIKEWLEGHKQVAVFAIVDDEPGSMGPLREHCVATNHETGMLDRHMVDLIERLNSVATSEVPRG